MDLHRKVIPGNSVPKQVMTLGASLQPKGR